MGLRETGFAVGGYYSRSNRCTERKKLSRPKTSTGKFISAEQGLCVMERDLFAFKMGVKQLPH